MTLLTYLSIYLFKVKKSGLFRTLDFESTISYCQTSNFIDGEQKGLAHVGYKYKVDSALKNKYISCLMIGCSS